MLWHKSDGTLASSPAGLAASRCQPGNVGNLAGNEVAAPPPFGYQVNVAIMPGWQRDAARPAGGDASAPLPRLRRS